MCTKDNLIKFINILSKEFDILEFNIDCLDEHEEEDFYVIEMQLSKILYYIQVFLNNLGDDNA